MRNIEVTINELYKEAQARFSENREVKKISIIDQYSKDKIGNIIWYEKYLEFLLDEAFLNEKDIDLLDIEVRYKYIDNKSLVVEGRFYDSSGYIIEEFEVAGSVNTIIENVISAIKIMISLYEQIISNYILN